VPAAVARRDLDQAILPAAESTDRDDRAAEILDRGDQVTIRDQRAPAATAADDQVFPAAATDRVAVATAGCDRIDPAVAIDQADLETVTGLDDQVVVIARDAPAMETDLEDQEMAADRVARVTDRVKVAAANNGAQEIDRDVPVIDPIGRIVRTIVPIADQIGTNGKIGETIVGPT